MPQFYADFLNKPSALNNNQTLNRYWMENSFGKYGVELVPFGPYRLPEASYQYHISRFNDPTADCPKDPPCDATNGAAYFNAVRDALERGRARRHARDVRQPVLRLRRP